MEAGECTLWELGGALGVVAGWLDGWVLLAGWLAWRPQGPQELRQPTQWRVENFIPGGTQQPDCKQKGSYNAVSCKLARSEGLTRL